MHICRGPSFFPVSTSASTTICSQHHIQPHGEQPKLLLNMSFFNLNRFTWTLIEYPGPFTALPNPCPSFSYLTELLEIQKITEEGSPEAKLSWRVCQAALSAPWPFNCTKSPCIWRYNKQQNKQIRWRKLPPRQRNNRHSAPPSSFLGHSLHLILIFLVSTKPIYFLGELC